MQFHGRLRSWAAVGCVLVVLVLALEASVSGERRAAEPPTPSHASNPRQPLLSEDFEAHPPGERWFDGREYGQWRAVYDGYGTTEITGGEERRLTMKPQSAARPEVTHGGLATTLQEFGDLDVTAKLGTIRQVRTGKANAWEVAWLLWHYTDDLHFYYVALKPNGWEVGKEDPAYPGAQRFLASGTKPRFPIGVQRVVRVRHVRNTIIVWVDGRRLATVTDRERPYSGGRVGLYTEDAEVQFDNIVVRRI
jgi:Domain of Unknown Function (DUF1080)